MSAINSPSYIVHHSDGATADNNGDGAVSGISLIDFIVLPGKSTISLHYCGSKSPGTAHGFLSLKRM